MYQFNFNIHKLFLFIVTTLFLIMDLDIDRRTGVWVVMILMWVIFILVGLYDIGKDEPGEAK